MTRLMSQFILSVLSGCPPGSRVRLYNVGHKESSASETLLSPDEPISQGRHMPITRHKGSLQKHFVKEN